MRLIHAIVCMVGAAVAAVVIVLLIDECSAPATTESSLVTIASPCLPSERLDDSRLVCHVRAFSEADPLRFAAWIDTDDALEVSYSGVMHVSRLEPVDGGQTLVVDLEEPGTLRMRSAATSWTIEVVASTPIAELDRIESRVKSTPSPTDPQVALDGFEGVQRVELARRLAQAWKQGEHFEEAVEIAALGYEIDVAGASSRCALAIIGLDATAIRLQDPRRAAPWWTRAEVCRQGPVFDARYDATLDYYEGLIAQHEGRSNQAVSAFAEAELEFRRIGMPRSQANVAARRARELSLMGQDVAAAQALETARSALAREDRASCDVSSLEVQRVTAELSRRNNLRSTGNQDPLAATPGHTVADVLAWASNAVAIARGPGCGKPPSILAAQLVEVNAAMELGALVRARLAFRAIDIANAALINETDYWELAADLARAAGDWPAAEHAHAQLVRLLASEHSITQDTRIREATLAAALGEHRAAVAPDEETRELAIAEAIGHYRRAEHWVEKRTVWSEIGAEAGRVAAMEAEPSQRLVDLLAREHRDVEAWCAARRLRTRGTRLRALAVHGRNDHEVRDAMDHLQKLWTAHRRLIDHAPTTDLIESRDAIQRAERALDDLMLARAAEQPASQDEGCDPDPGQPGDLSLLYHVDPWGHWVRFAWTGPEDLRIDPIDWRGPGSSPAPLLAGLAPRLGSARRVRILASGAAVEVDFAALLVDGTPLGTRMPVVWGLDLTPLVATTRPTDGSAVLAFGDPGNMGNFKVAARRMKAALAGAWPTLIHYDGSSDGPTDLATAASGASLLVVLAHHHRSGPEEPGLPDGRAPSDPGDPEVSTGTPRSHESGTLPTFGLVVGSEVFNEYSVLGMEEPPRRAVIVTCEAEVVDVLGLGGAAGFGHALVARGTEEVLATIRVIDANEAEQIAALVEAVAGAPELPLAEHVRRLRVSHASDAAVLTKLRVFAP